MLSLAKRRYPLFRSQHGLLSAVAQSSFLGSAHHNRSFSSIVHTCQQQATTLSHSQYVSAVESTIENISHRLEDMADDGELSGFEELSGEVDISVSEGVLSVVCGDEGTFIISRQTPTQQLWLSSPISGPWHYTFDQDKGDWKCTKGDMPFFDRMDKELTDMLNIEVKFDRNLKK